MTTLDVPARRLLSTLLGATLAVSLAACGDDGDGTNRDANPSTNDASVSVPDASAPVGDSGGGGACLDTVYSALSDGCSSCACQVDPMVAPACQKPCWDFIACSFAAQTGKCATFAAGGEAMRPQFEACTMEECGAQLAVPGAQVVSSYRSIIGACAVPMGGAPAACSADIATFRAALGK